MENQHRAIKGYRELDEHELAAMNGVKEIGAKLGEMVDQMRQTHGLDQRWVSIGATHLQEGLMALTRSIAKPTFFVALFAVLLTGCASGGIDLSLPQHPAPKSLGELLANVKGDTVIDFDAAIAIAVAHGDVLAQDCLPVLKRYVAPTGTATVDKVVGVFSAYEKLRVERMAIEGGVGQGIPLDLRRACAAYAQTEAEFYARMAAIVAGGVVPGVGAITPFLPK